MVVPGAAVTSQQSTDDSPSNIPESQVFEVSDDGQIHAWERSAYTLRTVDTDAPTAIPVPETVLGQTLGDGSFTEGNDGTESKSLVHEYDNQLNPIGVHNSGEPVTVSFRAGQATSGPTFDPLNDQENVEIVAARFTPRDGTGVPSTTSEAFDLLSDVENANENASFRLLEEDAALDSTGEISETASFEPGQYVVFAAVHEDGRDGFETDGDNDISVDGEVTIVGMDTLAVQGGETSVTAPEESEPGDSVDFTVDTSDAFTASQDGEITHAVAVYNASTFRDARFDLVVDESALGTDFDLDEDAELEHSIQSVNGVSDAEDGATLGGVDLTDGSVRRPVDASSVVDFFADEAGVDDPNVNPITNGGDSPGEYEQIDASMTAVTDEDRVADVSVDTFGNFSEGTYRYVVVSTPDSDETQLSTTTGTIELANSTTDPDDGTTDPDDGTTGPTGPGAGSGGGGGGGGGGGDPPADTGPIFTTPGQSLDGTLIATIQRVGADQQIVVTLPETADPTAATSLRQVTVTATGSASNARVGVTPVSQPTDGTPANDRAASTLGYVNVSLENLPAPDSTAGSFSFTVSEQRLDELGAAPENVVMYRYHNGSWAPLETSYDGTDFSATTPGFSWFAIGTANASVSVTDASLSATSADAGEPVSINATLTNSGEIAGNETLNLTVDGESVDSRTVTVDAGATTTETFSLTRDQPGTYSVAVNGVSAGALTVPQPAPPATATPTATPTLTDGPVNTGGQSGDGVEPGGVQPITIVVVIVIVALLGGAAYSLREQSK